MERSITIRSNDTQYRIYGTHRTAHRKSSTLVIFVHGLGGHQNEHIFYNGARFFEHKGIDTFRFNQYGWERDARNLKDITMATQAEDLDVVIAFFRKKYRSIVTVGHSLGAPTILLSRAGTTSNGIVLWDPTYDTKNLLKHIGWSRTYHAHVLEWGVTIIFGKKMHDEFKHYPQPATLLKRVAVPITIISAGNNAILRSTCKKYYAEAHEPKSLAIIPGARHSFDEDGVESALFNHTLQWVRKCVSLSH